MTLDQRLIAVGIVPPPLNGKTIVTRKIFDRLERSGFNRAVFVVSAIERRGFRSLNARLKMTFHVLRLTSALRLKGSRASVYLVAEGGYAIVFTILQALLLRLIAQPLVIHHHSRYWLDRPTPLLRRFLFDRSGVHIVQCSAMTKKLHDAYGRVRCMTLSNAFLVDAAHPLERNLSADGVIRLAHLSNLTLEKGLESSIATFEELKRRGVNVCLRLGGMPQDNEAERVLLYALKAHPEIEWLGQVGDAEKDAFFDGVTAFLFPTMYLMETEGIVTLEAMARSIPVIATDLCCLKENLERSGGRAFPASQDFPNDAAALLLRWNNDPLQHKAAKGEARLRFEELRAKSEGELDVLLDLLASGTPPVGADVSVIGVDND